jgi:hypothetical protein
MKRVTALLLATACAPPHFTGALDLARIEQGEIWLDPVKLPHEQYMMRAAAALDAPPWRVLNVYDDPEGFPLWNTAMESVRVLRREAEFTEIEVSPRAPLWFRAPPMQMRVRVDRAKGEVSLVFYENGLVRGGQWVTKVEPLGNGDRCLITAYASAETKVWWADFAAISQRSSVIESVLNLRRAVLLPRYGKEPAAAAPPASTGKVVVPGFRADGVDASFARTLTRIFAEQLMRKASWNVITQDEAAALLDYMHQQQLAGCEGETACVLDLGRALNADRIVAGSVGKVGDTFILSATLLKLPEGSVEKRISEEAQGDQGLLERVRAAAGEIARP